MPTFCTYFDHHYLPKALIMLATLRRHCPGARTHVLCLSEQCHGVMRELALPDVTLWRLDELEAADPALLAVKSTRGLLEYFWTLTPCLPHWLYRLKPETESITYLDADLCFLSDPRVLFSEAPEASVLLMPHNFPERLRHKAEAYGVYNVSWLTFANTDQGRACLDWYRERCLEWCHYAVEDGRMGDQKYLDYFADHFQGVHPLCHPGAGVAPWNVEAFDYALDAQGRLTVDGQPLIFYHAHAFWQTWWRFYDPGITSYCPIPPLLRDQVLTPYAVAMHRNAHVGDVKGLLRKEVKAFSPGLLPQIHRRARAGELVFANPFLSLGLLP